VVATHTEPPACHLKCQKDQLRLAEQVSGSAIANINNDKPFENDEKAKEVELQLFVACKVICIIIKHRIQ